jgi:hypothetical protein
MMAVLRPAVLPVFFLYFVRHSMYSRALLVDQQSGMHNLGLSN